MAAFDGGLLNPENIVQDQPACQRLIGLRLQSQEIRLRFDQPGLRLAQSCPGS